MTEKMNKEDLDRLVKEELNKMKGKEEKESFIERVKKTLTSDTAKEVYKTMAMGILQGAIATWTFDTIKEIQTDDETIIEIEE